MAVFPVAIDVAADRIPNTYGAFLGLMGLSSGSRNAWLHLPRHNPERYTIRLFEDHRALAVLLACRYRTTYGHRSLRDIS
jgi:hypothetical protein